MFDMSAINDAKKKVQVTQDKHEENFNAIFEQASNLLTQYTQNKQETTLKQASQKLFEAMKVKRSRVETYFYLSYIFYLFSQNDLAIEYLKIAKSIDPDFQGIKNLEQTIYS